jgi:predicted GNAT family N-acyltransferase
MSGPAFGVRATCWDDDEPALRAVREAVFVVEQGIPPALEWDADDARSVHVLAEAADGAPIGCARLLPEGSIGRVAVLAHWRGRGVGDAMMRALLERARAAGHARVSLHSQVQACAFYARQGFTAVGEAYEEAGIAHQTMVREFAAGRA